MTIDLAKENMLDQNTHKKCVFCPGDVVSRNACSDAVPIRMVRQSKTTVGGLKAVQTATLEVAVPVCNGCLEKMHRSQKRRYIRFVIGFSIGLLLFIVMAISSGEGRALNGILLVLGVGAFILFKIVLVEHPWSKKVNSELKGRLIREFKSVRRFDQVGGNATFLIPLIDGKMTLTSADKVEHQYY